MKRHHTATLHQESERRLKTFLEAQAGTVGTIATADLVRRFVQESPQGAMVVVVDGTRELLVVSQLGFLDSDGSINADIWSVHVKLSANGGINFGVKASWDASFGRMSFR